jgi:SulP family sulfate permease
VANIVTGFFGGMGGCAMIGQTMINVRSGARTRLSTFLAGVFLLILVVALGDVVSVIPMAALVAVMIFVSIATFDWHSLQTIHRMPRSETAVMLSTVAVTLITHNLAIGVGVGVLVACVLFAQRIAHLVDVTRVVGPDGTARYSVDGALFFASSNDLYTQFEYADDPQDVVIDLSGAHVWDASTVAALDAITHKYATRGKRVQIVGLNENSSDRFERHTGQLSAH